MKYVSAYLAFFVMGAADILATVLVRIKAECAISSVVADVLPFMMFVWFLFLSVPSAVLCGRIGRRFSVSMAAMLTAASLSLPMLLPVASPCTWMSLFALLGASNVLLQVALPGLLSEIVGGRFYASGLTIGYFIKMSGGVVAPLAALMATLLFGDWKFMLYGYALVAVIACVGVLRFSSPDAGCGEAGTDVSFSGCFRLLARPYISAMVVGIALAVGADVVFSISVPGFLMDAFGASLDAAATAPSVFYGGKIVGMALCAVLLLKVPTHKCFFWMIGSAMVGALCLAFAPSMMAFLALTAVVALGTSNTMAVCVALAFERFPGDKDGMTALLMMAIAGGGIVPCIEISIRHIFGCYASIGIMFLCLLYVFIFGIHACKEMERVEKAKSAS